MGKSPNNRGGGQPAALKRLASERASSMRRSLCNYNLHERAERAPRNNNWRPIVPRAWPLTRAGAAAAAAGDRLARHSNLDRAAPARQIGPSLAAPPLAAAARRAASPDGPYRPYRSLIAPVMQIGSVRIRFCSRVECHERGRQIRCSLARCCDVTAEQTYKDTQTATARQADVETTCRRRAGEPILALVSALRFLLRFALARSRSVCL